MAKQSIRSIRKGVQWNERRPITDGFHAGKAGYAVQIVRKKFPEAKTENQLSTNT